MAEEGKGGSQIQNHNANTGYSQEYVSSLRDEAASWRTKLRESEEKSENMLKTQFHNEVNSVLKNKGLSNIKAEWIESIDAESIDLAVDKFVEQNPLFKSDQTIIKKETKQPMNTTKENTNSNNRFESNPDLASIRKDPIARSKMREQYRTLLRNKNKQVI